MKGIYFQRKTNENPHVAEYKSLYINHDKNMWYLIIWMSLHIAMLGKVVGKISNCMWAGRLRWAGMAALIPLIYLSQYNFTSFAKCVLSLQQFKPDISSKYRIQAHPFIISLHSMPFSPIIATHLQLH
jgi:hypothetical protein